MSPATSLAHSSGERTCAGSLLPTSDKTSNDAAARTISSRLSVTVIGATPRETSTASKPTSAAQWRQSCAFP